MKLSPDLKKVQENMQPGVITQTGFLGDDARSFIDIIAHDEELMDEVGITFEQVVDQMNFLLEEGLKGLGEPTHVKDTWLVKIDEARGYLPCPWEDGIYRKRNVQVKHLKSGKVLNFSDLSIHMINAHHFLQGKGAEYRLEPALLRDVLEL